MSLLTPVCTSCQVTLVLTERARVSVDTRVHLVSGHFGSERARVSVDTCVHLVSGHFGSESSCLY